MQNSEPFLVSHREPAQGLWQAVTAHHCTLGESPFWHPQEQMLYWVDIAGKQILRASVDMAMPETWDLPSEPGCMAPAIGGGLVLALRHGVFRASEWGGPLQRLTTLDYDPLTLRANDGKCDTLGRFWVGTIDETRSKKNAALFCIDGRARSETGQATVSCMISPNTGMSTANALAWSPHERTLYWADTPSHTVWAWDFDAPSGAMTRQRVFARFAPKPANWQPTAALASQKNDAITPENPAPAVNAYAGRPDGAAVDVQGNYWVALFEGQRVCQFGPDGSLLASIATPLQCPTMPCFGGADLKTLYLTSARHHRSAAELAAFPLSGCVLSMRVEVPGLPVNFFRD